ncbi:phosophoadenylyl-sulfate reductase [Basidiobolus meristosporus CBS 931.73]|uniref:Phosophoadenylyl-sulfate reductase n=1 Tax=Basidiobolus meristosporus CBS 931.73 TaxID=1314790 RepID=A0A1Y1YQA0_9FUNG|nr:phosophoadenylyl-sulfate reductase [Basidiobolus meristosporus CBS 931.73]|eukprot:ORY00200.1 phosophoadenylyl-sulfate reductase [Basidiobolus meristosporus CBS 931.73]
MMEWALLTLPNLYQTTAFGPSGLVALDMISKISRKYPEWSLGSQKSAHLVPLIFVDTLYHFNETLELAKTCERHYNAPLHTFRPDGIDLVETFEKIHGERFWTNDEDSYDFLVKIEPARRAYHELNVTAVITGRRRSQSGSRSRIVILEMEAGTGLLKLNPLANWSFDQVWSYIRSNHVPYNTLLDQGYRSIGDWHSTKPTPDLSDERSGRWSGSNKTECGLH